ncbi:uncharacterized protein C1683.06c-like [Thrips palmi]|uniref:Uncharacterized protein C1683.06c-like n=1 Tax=Thrips palmi TaxID=161013 RepID=A0A6P8Z265_THRPL|nr:uncharacterized protein C1683.06c-like [Thrips palmi]
MSGAAQQRRLVVVDVDTGTDDALALLMLLAADAVGEVKLLGVTCVAGNTPLANVCRNTLRLLRAANRLDIPVFAGADGPLVTDRPVTSHPFHGRDGFGDLDHEAFPGDDSELDGFLQKENAVAALNRLVCENEGEVTLVCLAPLTNIALAVRTYSAFKKSLREVHIMGGNVRGHGNTTPAAEFNFCTDPEAAHVVLESLASTCPVQLTPWETCTDLALPLDWRLDVLPREGGVASGDNLALQLVTEADRRVLSSNARPSWVCCDQLTVAALLRPALVLRHHLRHVTVELGGWRTRGQMVPGCVSLESGCRPGCVDAQGRRPVRVLDAIDMDAFKQLLCWASRRWTRLPRVA